jgi:hypothetical protein
VGEGRKGQSLTAQTWSLYLKGERNKGTTKRSEAMRPRHIHPLCDEVCHDDEMDQVDASKPRPRPRPHNGEGLGPKVTGNYVVTLLGHRPTRTQPQGPKSHTLKATYQGQQGRKTVGMMPKAAVKDQSVEDSNSKRVTQSRGVPAVLQAQPGC